MRDEEPDMWPSEEPRTEWSGCICPFSRLLELLATLSPPLQLTCCKPQSCSVLTFPQLRLLRWDEFTAPVAALERTGSYLSTFISASRGLSRHTDSKVTTHNLEPQIYFTYKTLGFFFSWNIYRLFFLNYFVIIFWARCALLVWPRSWFSLLLCARSRGTSAMTFQSARRIQISSSPVQE